MTEQEKCLFIIKELELSARKVGVAIGKSQRVVSDKMRLINSNRFLTADFERLKQYYLEKLKKIEKL